MAIRATNVYEEKSLGVAESDETNSNSGLEHLKQEEGFVSLHLRDQLAVCLSFKSPVRLSEACFDAVRCMVHHIRRLPGLYS